MDIKHLGPYELGEPLGKGGMGTVYRATHRDTGEPAAVKALAPNLAGMEGFRDRFEAEIESLKLLKHPGIVRLLGYGEQDGVLFYAMELVEGTSLEEELRAGRRFTWLEVTDYGIQICRALKHAHDHGVIHRDIKPANELLDREGRIKIADFGIARLFGATQLTSAGGVLGTADYMSPEQTDGRNVTEKCDQYSLGGVMYALLAGRPPFRARSLPEMLQLQRFADPEPVRRYASEAPQQLERLIMQLLSKDPADRFPNVLVLARHMEAMRRALSRPAPDDFALSSEAPPQAAPAPDPSYEAIAMDTTRIEPGLSRHGPEVSQAGESAVGAPTPSHSPEPPPNTAETPPPSVARFPAEPTQRGLDATGPFTHDSGPADEEFELEPPARVTGRMGPATTSDAEANRPSTTRFQTVDEDLLEPREEAPSRLLLAAQVVGLLAAIGLLAGSVWYFSWPATADQLYAQIAEVARQGKVESLRTVEDEIGEFLERFPDDERSEEIAGYREEIHFSRLEDRLYRRAQRPRGPQALAPIEQMYLDAIAKADYDPNEAIEDLRAILVLYGARGAYDAADDAADDAQGEDAREFNRRVEQCLRLVEQRLTGLTRYAAMAAEQQMPVLRRRIEAARALEATDRERARIIYMAILDLYEEKAWAADVVEEAAAALQRLRAVNAASRPDQPADS